MVHGRRQGRIQSAVLGWTFRKVVLSLKKGLKKVLVSISKRRPFQNTTFYHSSCTGWSIINATVFWQSLNHELESTGYSMARNVRMLSHYGLNTIHRLTPCRWFFSSRSLLVSHIAHVFKLTDQRHNCGINWDGNIRKTLTKLLLYCFKRFNFKIRC